METKNKEEQDEYLAALGLFTMAWSGLHAALEVMIWSLLRLDEKRGRIITSQLSSKALIETVQALFNSSMDNNDRRYPNLKKSVARNFATKLIQLNNKRNDIMHSHWRVSDVGEGKISILATRSSAKGELKLRHKSWTRQELIDLSEEVGKTTAFLIQIVNVASESSSRRTEATEK